MPENQWDQPIDGMPADAAPEPAPAAPAGRQEVPGKDEAAPYGRRADGKPRRKPGPSKGSTSSRPGAPRPTVSAPRRPAKVDYRPAILGLVQLVAAPLAVAGQRSPVAAADAATLVVYAQPLADGLQVVSENDTRVAQLLDRVAQVGPYGAVLAPVMGLATQLLVNHGVIPLVVGAQMGAMAPDDVIRVANGQPPAAAAAA